MLSLDHKVYGQIFNIGNPNNEITMLDLGKLIQKISDRTSKVELVSYNDVFKNGSFEDMARRMPDIKKIEKAIGWKPKKNLYMIIDDVIKHESKPKQRRNLICNIGGKPSRDNHIELSRMFEDRYKKQPER